MGKMKRTHSDNRIKHFLLVLVSVLLLLVLMSVTLRVKSQTNRGDVAAMMTLKQSLNPPTSLGWTDLDPCRWKQVSCTDGRITKIQIGNQGLSGTLPSDLQNLTALERLELMNNNISGPLPSWGGLGSLRILLLSNNQFSSIPADFFSGLSSLQVVELDQNPFSAWEIPVSLQNATYLVNFSANSANIRGKIPDFVGGTIFPSLKHLHLAFNNLEGELPASLAGSLIQSLWLNGQATKLNGSIEVLQNMTSLTEVWLHSNAFTGTLPDFSGLKNLQSFSVRDNQLTGPVPASLVSLPSLKIVNLTNNLLQGATPKFPSSLAVDMAGINRFCSSTPGAACDSRVNALLSIAQDMDYPLKFAQYWKGNDPCNSWFGIVCSNGDITVINIRSRALTGMISPNFSKLHKLQKLILANNSLTGTIPEELTTLPSLARFDVSNNQLFGQVPKFGNNIVVYTNGNTDIGKNVLSPTPGGGSSGSDRANGTNDGGQSPNGKSVFPLGVVVGCVFLVFFAGLLVFCICQRKQNVGSPNVMAPSNIQVVDIPNMVIIPIEVLRNATDNFSELNILGHGGFAIVYKGRLDGDIEIAVKRMNSGVVTEQGLTEYKSEIAALRNFRHRHLVPLLGYCLDGNEKLLVYEYMPQGTLSRHLFNWAEEGLSAMPWEVRLSIALDVARGVEYLHGLANQSFVHRDLKPSNILLGNDMRAKVADFGLIRLVPEGEASVESKIAGTFGYMDPEYVGTGRLSSSIDVYSFGVILMELITGRRVFDISQPEERRHLVTWFGRMHIDNNALRMYIDPTITVTEENFASISAVVELARHCCMKRPRKRPNMANSVNVLSSLAEPWKPSDQDSEDMALARVLMRWQAFEGSNHSSPYFTARSL